MWKREEILSGKPDKERHTHHCAGGIYQRGKIHSYEQVVRKQRPAEDKLFATLDPTTRSFRLSDGREALLIDTVGFIRKLPHELVEAFKSTLEEAVYADMLIHVVDASNEEAEEQVKVVNDILESLGAANKPVIMALNKMDMVKGGLRLAISNPNGRYLKYLPLQDRE